ncbi:MAG: endonuclease/exonuclease/phosphatase family protein [Treponema sp.]|jgi:hypothetical protein|nr:endonuclease/exonuclease/phosphatase family protein [Treponema sp.]
MSKPIIIVLIIAVFTVLLLLFAGAGIMWYNAGEYLPAARETVPVSSASAQRPDRFQPIELYSWNIGYASLDTREDFFTEGGKSIRPASASIVEENIWAIQAFISASSPDIVFLQEVDVNSRRSYGINQAAYFSETWKGSSSFAYNFKCLFVPVFFPFPHFIGRVESGLLILNSYNSTAERISLHGDFPWPERIYRQKHCLLVERVPVQDTGVELVLVNLYLDAYDSDGGGRLAQTKVLAEFLKAEYARGNYCIAGGDFNQVFPALKDVFPVQSNLYFSPGMVDNSLFDEGWILAADPEVPSRRSLDKPYEGSREGHQFYITDGFILSPNVELLSVHTLDLDFKNSNHNPVKLTFSLK